MSESNNHIDMPGISEDDSFDISELASLNEDYSVDFIEQLQRKLEQENLKDKPKNVGMDTDDTKLFEDKPQKQLSLNEAIDDNFMKKYKAKLKKQQEAALSAPVADSPPEPQNTDIQEISPVEQSPVSITEPANPEEVVQAEESANATVENNEESVKEPPKQENIEAITGGNIIQKPLDSAQLQYSDSLDYLDGNIKYSKYVIYIDPENKDFIDSLTVKERKNLINRIIREQDSVIVTKKKLLMIQTIITHLIIAILTIIIAIPCIYWVFNVSLENTINNYRTSQAMFMKLYKEKGKIKSIK